MAKRKSPRTLLSLETLEGRVVPATVVIDPTQSGAAPGMNGPINLHVNGGDLPRFGVGEVVCQPSRTTVTLDGRTLGTDDLTPTGIPLPESGFSPNLNQDPGATNQTATTVGSPV